MKEFDNIAAQGELYLIRIEDIPGDAKPIKAEKGNNIVGHSETGHHHVVPAVDAHLFQAANDPMTMYLHVINETTLKHMKGFDTHEPVKVKPGKYIVPHQREGSMKGWRPVAD